MRRKNKSLIEKEQNNKKIKRILLIVLPIVTSFALIVGGMLLIKGDGLNGFFGSKEAKVEEKVTKKAFEIQPENEKEAKLQKVLGGKNSERPFEIPEWKQGQVQTYEEFTATKGEILKREKDGNIALSASVLPSEAQGATSNNEEQMLSDGSYNLNYSYWTKELFTAEAEHILNTLINPAYGGWQALQVPDYEGFNKKTYLKPFSLIFTDSFIDKIVKGEKRIPVYGDWDNNNYGREDLFSSTYRWYGKQDSTDVEMKYNEKTLQYDAFITSRLTLSVKTINGEIVSKKGILKLKLVSNSEGANKVSDFRVLVDDGSLEVE